MIAALLLGALVVGDATLSGVRSVLGRDAHLDARALVRTGARRGAVAGGLVVVAVAVAALIGSTDPAVGSELVGAGVRALVVLGPFGLVAAAGFVGYLGPSLDARCLAVAVVLGPCTLARPAVLVIAAAAGGWTASGSVRAVALLGAVALVAVEPLLGRRARSIPPAGLPAGG